MKMFPVLWHVIWVLWGSPRAYRVPATAHWTVCRVWDTVPPNLVGYNYYCCCYFVINLDSSAPGLIPSTRYVQIHAFQIYPISISLGIYKTATINSDLLISETIFIVIDQNRSLIHAKCVLQWSDGKSHFTKHCCRFMVSPKFLNNVTLNPRNHV